MCVVRRCAGARTKAHRAMVRLRLLGAGPRLAGATLIVASLWVEFIRATSTPGAVWPRFLPSRTSRWAKTAIGRFITFRPRAPKGASLPSSVPTARASQDC